MTTIQPISEVAPRSDYREKGFEGFTNKTGNRTSSDIQQWAEDTTSLANYSVYSHLVELALKIPSYFVFNSDSKHTWWAKGIFAVERATGTLGDMFRNFIYSHKDKNGNLDDNIGAEIHAGYDPKYSLGIINNHTQTKGKFLISLLGLINPTLANDIEWAVVRALDGWWWRRMGINLAYGPSFGKKILKGDEQFTVKSFVNTLKEHCTNAKTSLKEKNKESFLSFCEHTDKAVSSFLPIVNCLNIAGDIARPIARRLELSGALRNIIRLLSVIDRPFFWATNFFRFYLPEKHIQNKQAKETNNKIHLSHSDILAGSILGDMLDFILIALEDKIKESSNAIQHTVEIIRRITHSASDIYFSMRRNRASSYLESP